MIKMSDLYDGIKWETINQCINRKNLYQTVKYVIRYTPNSSGIAALNYLNSIIQHSGRSPYKEELLKWMNDSKSSYPERLKELNELQQQYELYKVKTNKASSSASLNQTSQKNNFDKTAEVIQTGPGNKEEDQAMQPSAELKNEKPPEKKSSRVASYNVNPESANIDENKSNSLPPSTKPSEVFLQNTGDMNKPPMQSKNVECSSANDSSKTPVLSVQTSAKIDERKAACSGDVASAKPTQENTSGSDSTEKNLVKPPNNYLPIIARSNIPEVHEQPPISQAGNNSDLMPSKAQPNSTVPGVKKLQEAQTKNSLTKFIKTLNPFSLAETNKNVDINQGENNFAQQLANEAKSSIPEQAQAEKTVPNNTAASLSGGTKKEYNILLFGETGVGKSTFINGFCNYNVFESFEEALSGEPLVIVPFQFSVDSHAHTFFGISSVENENFSATINPSTQESTNYKIFCEDICYNFLDTPGVFQNSSSEIALLKKEIDILLGQNKKLDAFCLFLKSDNQQINLKVKEIFKIIYKTYKDSIKNFYFWFTFCPNGFSLNTLKKWISDSEMQINISMENCFTIENNAIRQLCCQHNKIDNGTTSGNWPFIIADQWKENCETIKRFKASLVQSEFSCPMEVD